MVYQFKTVSSLEKIFFENPENIPAQTEGSMLKNESYSFQLAVWWTSDGNNPKHCCRMEIESELEPFIKVYSVGYVPVLLPCTPGADDENYLRKEPGLFPDPLYRIKDGMIQLADRQARAFWVCVETDGKISGEYPIKFNIYNPENKLVGNVSYLLKIIEAELPKQKIHTTCWFHGDCLAKLHNAEVLTEEYFELVNKYMQVYVKFGHNMILTPVFTPPLDTEIGGERPTNQLVGVILTKGVYSFDFTNLRRWIDVCRQNGIEYYEISHLFTQWGAKATPKIMAEVDGEYKRIFGWDVSATSGVYKTFLDAFLPELIKFLKDEGIYEKCLFHISDEPMSEHQEQYEAAKAMLTPYIEEEKLMDALSDYKFYEKGVIKQPVAANDHIQPFIDNEVKDLWTYYCCAQTADVANRFIAMPSYRNRILGCQLYKYKIKGFLHWGFNFWFTQLSTKVINPYVETQAGGGFPSGDSFIVYSLDENGEVVCSLRLYVFNEALQDLRALELLESHIGYDETVKFLEEVENFKQYPRSGDYILKLRQKINREIEKCIKEI